MCVCVCVYINMYICFIKINKITTVSGKLSSNFLIYAEKMEKSEGKIGGHFTLKLLKFFMYFCFNLHLLLRCVYLYRPNLACYGVTLNH